MRALRSALIGTVLAVVTVVAATLLGRPHGLELLAAILVAAGAVYPGAALAVGDRRKIALETAVGAGFIAVALLGLWFSSALLAAGYLAHAVWDLLHHPHRVGARAGGGFPPLCLAYDVVVGLFVVGVY